MVELGRNVFSFFPHIVCLYQINVSLAIYLLHVLSLKRRNDIGQNKFTVQVYRDCTIGCGDIHFKKSIYLGTQVISSLTDRSMTVQSKL